ncbi:MAG: hypothetical protein AAF495_02940 [Pseudomonadota bacterium]
MAAEVALKTRIAEEPDGSRLELLELPAEEAFLDALLRDIFQRYWQQIVFGPMIQGAAYEIRCPGAPTKIGLADGYLTIFFGRTHFHLCIGDNCGPAGNPTPTALRDHRRTKEAAFFRGLDKTGAPVTWGLRLINGAGEPQMTIFFPNPFLSDDDEILAEPQWERLSVWQELLKRYLGQPPDPRDRSAQGFSCC